MKELTNLKEKFIEQLEKACTLYKVIGVSTKESPMWLQLRYTPEKNTLLFRNSQSNVWISIQCTTEEKKYAVLHPNEAYDYFKYLKYTHLKNNHPEIWSEFSPSWLYSVDTFLAEYSMYRKSFRLMP